MDNHSTKLFISGRICLFGEHSDWAAERGRHNGYCLVTGTDQGFSAVARPAPGFIVDSPVPNGFGRPSARRRQMSCAWDGQTLMEAARDRDEFFRYCAGVARRMLDHPGVRGGLDLHIASMDLPLRKGVSSSAAVCILVAQAFNRIYQLGLFPHELMEVAYEGEKLTGSQCGRMDQACIYGKTPVLLTFSAGSDVRIEPVFPRKEIPMFFVDLAGEKDTVTILGDLQRGYETDPDLREALGSANEATVRAAYCALQAGDAELLGELMTRAQADFDRSMAPHSPRQLASPHLHELLAWDDLRPHIYGGKGVGSQGDGTAQFVARSREDRDLAMALIEEHFEHMQCFPLTILARPTSARNVDDIPERIPSRLDVPAVG